jgi:hypothetical protein
MQGAQKPASDDRAARPPDPGSCLDGAVKGAGSLRDCLASPRSIELIFLLSFYVLRVSVANSAFGVSE